MWPARVKLRILTQLSKREIVLNRVNQPKNVAIDGPAASGKTTVGRMLAEKLNYLFLDTGCMYRAVTLAALEQAIDTGDEAALAELTATLDLIILPAIGEGDGRLYTVLLDGRDVTWAIRSAAVDTHVSRVSAVPDVRRLLVERQRAMAKRGGVV